jgi:hypothetical protein
MGLWDFFKSSDPLDDDIHQAIERAADSVNPLFRQVGGYRKKLAPAVRIALDYCDGIARNIPGPFEISRKAFSADPLVHALFASADDIETMLARSQCIREAFAQNGIAGADCWAMMGMRHRERSGFGVQLSGETLQFDVPQKMLYFTDHTLAELHPDLESLQRNLRSALFDSLLKSFAAHIAELKAERAEMLQAQAMEAARMRRHGIPGIPAEHMRHPELSERMRAAGDVFLPGGMLHLLSECLADPAPYLRLEPVKIAVDRSGVITGMGGEGAGDTLHFAELTGRDRRRWVVILAAIERAEIERAMEQLTRERRYIVI